MSPRTRSKSRKGTKLQRGTIGWLHTHKTHIAVVAAVPLLVDILLYITISVFQLEAAWAYAFTRMYNTAISAMLYILSDGLLLLGLGIVCYGGGKYWRQDKTGVQGSTIALCGLYTIIGACTVIYWCFTVCTMFEVWLKYNMVKLDIPFKDTCDNWLYPCLEDLDGIEL